MYENFKTGSIYGKKIDLFDFNNAVNGLIDGHLGKNTLAETTYNFDYSSGALKCGVGVKQLEILFDNNHFVAKMPDGLIPKKIFYYKRYDEINFKNDDRILVLFSNGEVYEWHIYLGTNKMVKIENLNFSKTPFYVNYRLNGEDVILFSTDGVLYVYNGEKVTTFDAPLITSMCIHNERLYATTGYSETELWFSKTFDPTNWNVNLNEAGFIDFRTKAGRLLKVISFGGYLYAFANYGIFRITAFNNQLEMTADSLFVNSGRIIRNSCTECGKYVIYLAEDGFYRFDGSSSVRIMRELDKYLIGIDNEDISAIYHNGKFYASVNLNIDGDHAKMMVCYDLGTHEFYLAKGLNCYDLEKIEGAQFSFLATLIEGYNQLGMLDNSGNKFGIPLTKIWKSNKTDYNVFYEKTLSYISLYTRSDIRVEVESNISKQVITFSGSKFRQKKPVMVKGNTFQITIKSQSRNAEISKVLLEIQYL